MLRTLIFLIWICSACFMLKLVLENDTYHRRDDETFFDHCCGILFLVVLSPMVLVTGFFLNLSRGRQDDEAQTLDSGCEDQEGSTEEACESRGDVALGV